MEKEKTNKKTKILKVVVIIFLLLILAIIVFFKYKNIFGNASNKVLIDYVVATDELMEKYYGKKYIKELEKNREKEEKEILSKYYEPESTATNIVENGSSIFQTDINEFLVQVVPDEDIPIRKSEETFYLDLIDIYNNQPITEKDKYYIAQRLKVFYDNLIRKNIPIVKKIMTLEEAERFYRDEGTVRGRLQLNVNKEKVSLYYCEDYFNYFYGTMPISTGFAEIYDIAKYHNGLLVRYPSMTVPNELPKYVKSMKLASALDEYDEIYKIMGLDTVYKLNKKILEGKTKELILFSEALHEKKIAELSNKIKQRGNVKLVLIAGPSSSGKTTFAGKLGMSLRVNGLKPVTISVDNYFVERENNPRDEFGNYDFECIEALDLKLLNDQLLDLLNRKRS